MKAWYQLSKWIAFHESLLFRVPFQAFKSAEGTTDPRPHPAKRLCLDLLNHAEELLGTRKRETYISEVQQSFYTVQAYAHHCQT